MTKFSTVLEKWYALNARDLPWRNRPEPYSIWLSEVILQQTQVAQGMSYYIKFMELFPNVGHLARASEDEVLKAWQGLGYYSRARNLHKAAKVISENLHGKFPTSSKELEELPGIGIYTAAAIASIAYNEPVAVVDGNVYRVLSRYFGVATPIDSPAGKKEFADLAAKQLNSKRPGMHNQAVMDFGAMVCTPKLALCGSCPLGSGCKAIEGNFVYQVPVKSKKTAVKEIWLTYFYVIENGHTYVERRNGAGIWKGLYNFPNDQSEIQPAVDDVLNSFADAHLDSSSIMRVVKHEVIAHQLTHRKIYASFISLYLDRKPKYIPEEWQRISCDRITKYGVPRLIEKFLESL
jgi:A/G-specific adenine glycosylase